MKDLAFVQDPDGYWIEILSPNNMVSLMSPWSRDAADEQNNNNDTEIKFIMMLDECLHDKPPT